MWNHRSYGPSSTATKGRRVAQLYSIARSGEGVGPRVTNIGNPNPSAQFKDLCFLLALTQGRPDPITESAHTDNPLVCSMPVGVSRSSVNKAQTSDSWVQRDGKGGRANCLSLLNNKCGTQNTSSPTQTPMPLRRPCCARVGRSPCAAPGTARAQYEHASPNTSHKSSFIRETPTLLPIVGSYRCTPYMRKRSMRSTVCAV